MKWVSLIKIRLKIQHSCSETVNLLSKFVVRAFQFSGGNRVDIEQDYFSLVIAKAKSTYFYFNRLILYVFELHRTIQRSND